MRALVLLVALCCVSVSAQTYDTSNQVIEATPQRSRYFVHGEYKELKMVEFLERADPSTPLVIHSHGCARIGNDEDGFNGLLRIRGINFIAIDFLARGVPPSCPNKSPSDVAFGAAANPERIAARRLEMEKMVAWAKEKGLTKIWVTSHSEGGRVAQGLKAEVTGVMIFAMDCKNMPFWSPNPKNQVHVFISSRDPWVGQGGAGVRGCGGWFDSNVTNHWSKVETQTLLGDAAWYELVPNMLKGR